MNCGASCCNDIILKKLINNGLWWTVDSLFSTEFSAAIKGPNNNPPKNNAEAPSLIYKLIRKFP